MPGTGDGQPLRIRPVIEVRQDGTMRLRKKLPPLAKALQSLLKDFNPCSPTLTFTGFLSPIQVGDSDAEYLKIELKKLAKIDEIHITYAGATIASHCVQIRLGSFIS